MAAGRPSTYDIKYCDMIIEHFNIPAQSFQVKTEYNRDGSVKSETKIPVAAEFPTFQSFANKIGVNGDTLVQWSKDHEEFSAAYARAKELQEHIWLVNSMSNQYNSQFAQFFGKNCLGYKDKVEVDQKVTTTNNLSELSEDDLKSRLAALGLLEKP